MRTAFCYLLAAVLSFAPVISHAGTNFFRSAPEIVQYFGSGDASGEKRALPRIPRFYGKNGHYIDVNYDVFGRIALMASKNGTIYELLYENFFSKTPNGVLVNGLSKAIPLSSGGKSLAKYYKYDDDLDAMRRQLSGYLGMYGDCIGCVTLDDAVNFVSALLISSGLGTLVGAYTGVLFGADAMGMAFLAGAYGLFSFAIAVSTTGGYIVGTMLYDGYTWAYYDLNLGP